jgi:lysophospholipase L1-like esterase
MSQPVSHTEVSTVVNSGGWVENIQQEYQFLNKDPVITTMIMDGGGNDVFSNRDHCTLFDQQCKDLIDKVTSIAEGLLKKMDEDGIEHVIYLGFYYIPGLEQAVDYGSEKMSAVCEAATVGCHFADPRWRDGKGFNSEGHLAGDGVHPTDEGYEKLAEIIWAVHLDHDVPI